jgi:transcriptional regulator with XRE-family HTH domain
MPKPRKPSTPATPSRFLFGQRLREERLKRGMTLEDLSEASGITWSYIAQVEVGRRNIAVDNMHVLAQGVGVALPDLLSADDPTSGQPGVLSR